MFECDAYIQNYLFYLQSACWSPNGRTLLFTTEAEPTVFSLTFTDSLDQEKPVVGGAKDAVPVIDLSEVDMETPDGPVR